MRVPFYLPVIPITKVPIVGILFTNTKVTFILQSAVLYCQVQDIHMKTP